MAEELIQDGVCGGNWWNPARSLFGSSPCSSTTNDKGSFGSLNDELVNDLKKTWCSDESNSNSEGKKSQHPVIDSTLQMMGISFSSSTVTDHWNQDFLQGNGISEGNYSHIKQVNRDSGMNYQQQTGIDSSQINQMDWNLKNFSTAAQNSSFPLNSASDSDTSSFLQTLYDTYSDRPQQLLSDNAQAMNFSSAINYPVKSNEFSLSLPKQQPVSHLQFSDNSPFSDALNDNRPSLFPSTQARFPSSLNPLGSEAMETSIEPSFKRSRIETPSPLPTFKIRKEKLGDRITALQQLVSPFGKTDTASVLQEAIEYIRFLHNQVLSTTYTKNGYLVHCQEVILVHVMV
ncbi:transcription factor bHLH112-like [Olea europaea subsp. europaea]|uniref:Transcription factor bHLH112-like n=1 Tax=Olea europaea subsp. europaea TaxID=158383 RepID=A0A8S0UEJ5_OLEEU|nr:transcription factor bHLH112-like [Olea europaea subsp. europaea]